VPDDAYNALNAQLGRAAPEGLRQLSADELTDLAAAIREARHRQAKALAEAGDRALNHIPRLLRGPVRRIVR
jgi:predicted DNA-binding transcriptional regulator YafY